MNEFGNGSSELREAVRSLHLPNDNEQMSTKNKATLSQFSLICRLGAASLLMTAALVRGWHC